MTTPRESTVFRDFARPSVFLTAVALVGCSQNVLKLPVGTQLSLSSPSATAVSASAVSVPANPQPTIAPAPTAARTTSPMARADVSGNWIGVIECGPRKVRLKLLLSPSGNGIWGGLGEILSIADKPPSGNGAFYMNGDVNGNQVRLRFDRWSYKPLQLPLKSLDMDGAYAATTESLNLQSLDSACKPLQMTRVRLDDLTPTRPTAPVPGGAPPQTSGMTTRPATGAAATSRPNAPITFAALIDRLGEKGKNTQRLVGTQLQLQLKPGAIAGAEGFIQDVRMSTLFNCPAGSRFAGGPLTAKVKKLRVNDNGVFVDLDRCDN